MGEPIFLAKRVTYTSEASYIYERSELHNIRAKLVTYTSEASTNQLGVWGCKPPGHFLNLEALRVNLSVI